MRPTRIAILVGGTSSEAEISRISGMNLCSALEQKFAQVAVFELNAGLYHNLSEFQPQVVFPTLHGRPGEDGTIQGYLEILGYPYVGSGVKASSCAIDKSLAKLIFQSKQLPLVPDSVLHRPAKSSAIDNLAKAVVAKLGPELVVKPNSQGSSLGIERIFDGNLGPALESAFSMDSVLLVEKFIAGREITVSIIANHQQKYPQALPIIEIITPENSWYDFEHRYTPGLFEHVIPSLPEPLALELQKIAIDAHLVLDCQDLSRADFIVDAQDNIYLLEVNTMPGLTPTSLFPDAGKHAGYSFIDLCAHLVLNAWHRHQS